MKIAVTGASGFVGCAVCSHLANKGHSILHLVRPGHTHGDCDVQWNPENPQIDAAALTGCDAIIHLAGENIGGRWTPEKKRKIYDSRVQGTRNLCEALLASDCKPKHFLCASAIGFYGDRADEVVDESSPPGETFLSTVTQDWEAATQPLAKAGVRVVNLRIGMVLGPGGGALKKMLPAFKLGLGGKIGSGRQFWSWVSLRDVSRAIDYLLQRELPAGPVNIFSPNPVTSEDFAKTLAKELHRPAIFGMPTFAVRILFGEFADNVLLAGVRGKPAKLLDAGFQFVDHELQDALQYILSCSKTNTVAHVRSP